MLEMLERARKELTWDDIASLAFSTLGKPAHVRHVPVALARAVVPALRLFAGKTATTADFILRVAAKDLVAPVTGTRTLAQFSRAAATAHEEAA